MFGRSFKVFLIIILTGASFYLIFNYYLPSKISAYETERISIAAGSLNIQEEPQPSIAEELGIPEPKTITYYKFNPDNIKKQKKKIRKVFNIPEAIMPEVNFWKDIYTKYDKTKVLIHDKKHMNIVYSVIDISDIALNDDLKKEDKYDKKQERVGKEMDRIVAILYKLDEWDPNGTERLASKEQKIYDLFKNVREKNKFKNAAKDERIRSQTGIREKFEEAIKISGRYLGEIEHIFAQYGVPLEITRLAFVESMFNLNAVSKSGASGIWQFMPSTGKLFLNMDQIVDERNDPIIATHAAAKHLLRDYEALGSWPLAINAYNAGPGRLKRAINKLKTRDIAKIIRKYDHRGYSFASRNFYPAFLAALSGFENRDAYFGETFQEPPLEFDIITIPFFTTIPEIAKYTGTPIEELVLLNFHLKEDVVNGKLPLPVAFKLRVPKESGNNFLIAMKEIDSNRRYAKWHIVESGENLKTIATKYKTSQNKLKKINNLKRNRISEGMIIKLPKGIELAKD